MDQCLDVGEQAASVDGPPRWSHRLQCLHSAPACSSCVSLLSAVTVQFACINCAQVVVVTFAHAWSTLVGQQKMLSWATAMTIDKQPCHASDLSSMMRSNMRVANSTGAN